MKKLFNKNAGVKLIFALLTLILLLFFTNDFTHIDVEKTAIISAIGIDLDDDNNYSVSCQIVMPTTAQAPQTQVMISSSGKTVSEAISLIQSRTGWYPKLNFCNMLVFGDKVIKDDIITPLTYFFRSEHVNDSALVLASTTTAEFLLSQNTPLDNLSSYALQKVMQKGKTKISDVVSVNIKDIMKTYYSIDNAFIIPYVSAHKTTEGNEEVTNNSQENNENSGSAQSSAQDSGTQQSENTSVIFDATSSAIIVDEKFSSSLDKTNTRIYNLLMDKNTKAFYSANSVMPSDDALEIAVQDKSISKKYDVIGNSIIYKVNLKLNVKILDRLKKDNNLHDLTNNLELSDEHKKIIETAIKTDIENLFNATKNGNADILKLASNANKFNHNDYKKLMQNIINNPLENAKLELTVSVKNQ